MHDVDYDLHGKMHVRNMSIASFVRYCAALWPMCALLFYWHVIRR